MAQFCGECGLRLGVSRRFLGDGFCSSCSARRKKERVEREAVERAQRESARSEYQRLLGEIGTAGSEAIKLLPGLTSAVQGAGFAEAELKALNLRAIRSFVEVALADDILSEEEEQSFDQVITTLGVPPTQLAYELRDVLFRLIIAQANDGRLPVAPRSDILLKKNEVLHFQIPASLMKQVAVREYQGGYSGFSFRIVKGVRYHVGGTRGRSVVVGHEMKVVGTGILYLTSQRSVFVGAQQTIELPYSKLVTLNVFTDGVQFHQSNRKSAPLFQLENGDVVAAVVNTAAQQVSA